MIFMYCGPTKIAKPDELGALERKGWHCEMKMDGVYCEAWIGGGGVVSLARYRSGARIGADSGRDLLGLKTPFAPGSVIIGELMTSTPAAHAWQDGNAGVKGMVVFDILRWGNVDAQFRELAAGRLGAGALPSRGMSSATNAERRAILERLFEDVDGKAARVLRLVERRRRRLRDYYESVVAEGGEGVVLKDPSAPIGKGVRKVKRLDTLDCRVVSLHLGEGVVRLSLGGMPSFAVTAPRFEVSIGDVVEVKCMGFYEQWTPRHARIVRLRKDLVDDYARVE